MKFDEHEYYTYFSGQQRKGVDYLIINEDMLHLIELKNFQQYDGTTSPSDEALYEVFLQKCEGTFFVLEKFHEFMMSHWIRRVLYVKWKWYFTGDHQWKHWLLAYEHYKKGNVILGFYS